MSEDNQQPSPDFKPLKEDCDYLIYSDGRLFSQKRNRFLSGKIDDVGYQTYALAIVDKLSCSGKKLSKTCYAHRLVAEYFLDNPDKLPYVHHKDENKLNNSVANLEWVSAEQNMQYHNLEHVKKPRKEPRYFNEDLPGEEWMIVPDKEAYSVSSFGRVRNNNTMRLLHLDNNQAYTRVQLGTKAKHCYVHRLVYCTFNNDYDLSGYVIDHIDGNKKNNCLSNLQKIPQSENCSKQGRFNDQPTSA